MGNKNAFEGLDGYSVNLIHFKSRRLVGYLGLTESDRDDIEQDLAIHLMLQLPKHDPSRGALKTFINCVLDNRIRAIIKSRRCSTFDSGAHAYSLDAMSESASGDDLAKGDILDSDEYRIMLGNAVRPALENVELQVDVRRAVAALPEKLQKVCLALSHHSVAAAARELGISRPRLYEIMRQLREHLPMDGLDDYI